MANNKKQALGRGIDALFSNNGVNQNAVFNATEPARSSENIATASITELEANPYQPRKTFDDVALKELADSIKETGIIQPLVVRKNEDKYQIVAGERRFRAAKLVGINEIPIVVRQLDDNTMAEIAIIENLQRENLNPIEEAAGIKNFMGRMQFTQEQVADRLHKSRSAITNLLRLLNLPIQVQKLVIDQKLTIGHARALLSLNDETKINQIAELIVKDNLSVRQTEQIVKDGSSTKITNAGNKNKKSEQPNGNISAIVDALEEKLGSKVTIDKSKLTVALHGDSDLNRILEILDIEI